MATFSVGHVPKVPAWESDRSCQRGVDIARVAHQQWKNTELIEIQQHPLPDRLTGRTLIGHLLRTFDMLDGF